MEDEMFKQQITDFQESILPFFNKIDLDRNGQLDIEETQPLLNHFIVKYEEAHDCKLEGDDHKAMCEKLFNEMDANKDGCIDFHELKVFLTRKYDQMFRK